MAQHGWYPDPGGQAGMFRYWDGQAWSDVISPAPLPGPPAGHGSNAGAGFDPTQPLVSGTFASSYQSSTSTGNAYSQYLAIEEAKPRKPVAMWVTIIVGILVLALIAFFVVRVITGDTDPDTPTDRPRGNPTTQVCPQPSEQPDQPIEHPNDGRVHGGKLSYPTLGSPWGAPSRDEVRVPFGRDVTSQSISIHPNYEPLSDWVISVVVGQLYAGDGFYEPEEASEIVNRCIFGVFYGENTIVTPELLRSEPYSLDGYEGWITETNLSFSIPNLATTSELAIVIIVKTSTLSSSIFYASIPNDAMQYKPDVDQAIADLRVTE